MICNVVIHRELDKFFEIITYENIDGNEYVKLCKVKKTDVFPNTKIFMEMQIQDDLNDGRIELIC